MGKWDGVNKARARRVPGSLTRAERARAQALMVASLQGSILHWAHEPMRFRLAKGSFYAPDFLVIENDYSVVLEEVKGARGWKLDDEGRTKFKVAGELFPFFVFRGLIRSRRGTWSVEEYEPLRPFPWLESPAELGRDQGEVDRVASLEGRDP